VGQAAPALPAGASDGRAHRALRTGAIAAQLRDAEPKMSYRDTEQILYYSRVRYPADWERWTGHQRRNTIEDF